MMAARRKRDPEMDPLCVVCNRPTHMGCHCELKALQQAMATAEARMLKTSFEDVRIWVKEKSKSYILSCFEMRRQRRESDYNEHIYSLTQKAAYYRQPPHPAEIAMANFELKRGINEDWRNCVQRYPEILEYYFSLVYFTLPPDNSREVMDPSLSAIAGSRTQPGGRVRIEGMLPQGNFMDGEFVPNSGNRGAHGQEGFHGLDERGGFHVMGPENGPGGFGPIDTGGMGGVSPGFVPGMMKRRGR